MTVKTLFSGLLVAASLTTTAYAAALPYLPKAPFRSNGPVIRIADEKDLMDRRLCRGKYKNFGKCKDGVPTGDETDVPPEDLELKTEIENPENPEEPPRECEGNDCANNPESAEQPVEAIEPAEQPEQSLE